MHSIRRALTPLPPRVLPCRSFSSKTNTHPSHPSHTHRFLILGSPGSGKGTQTSRLTKHFPNLVTLSSGDLLRWHITNKTPLGSQISGFIKQGNYVPDSIVSELILQEVQTRYEGRHWLLDGFPRTVCQAKELDKVLAEKGVALSMVVNLDVPERVILDRIENRWIHAPSGRVYNYAFNPPKVRGKDDVTGEDLVKRDDDNPEIYKIRLQKYKESTLPLLEYYSKKGILKTFIGETSDQITPKLLESMQEFNLNESN